jgi:diguanylate cyclase (GGDEF)-like protein
VAVRRHNFLLCFGLTAAVPIAAAGFALSARLDGDAILAAGLGLLYLSLLPIAALAAGGLRRHAEKHEHLAHHDALTGLPNRMLFTRRLEDTLAGPQPVGVIVADVDRFKDVNDRFGHGGGDEVLRRVGERLDDCVRSTDTVARLGGDEFGVLLAGADAEEARQVARRIVEAIEPPLDVDGAHVQVTASLGVACSSEHGRNYDALLRSADFAMYEAKESGGGFRLAENPSEKPKAPGQAIGGLRPVRRAAPAKGG